MEQLTLTSAVITASSKRESKFASKLNNQTLYISLIDETQYEAAKKFGLTVYTAEDNSKFLIVKASKTINVWESATAENPLVLDMSITAAGIKTAGYESKDGKDNLKDVETGSVVILKIDNEQGKDFFRVSDYLGKVEEVKRSNPFA